MTTVSRRALLVPAGPLATPRPSIHPRAEWAGKARRPRGRLLPENDPLFLLVHHSESPTPTRPAQVPQAIRSFFDYHTGSKGWPDVAYNFFVDPFGRLWEGRAGSLAGPVRGDATGGSQGHAELVCFIGSFSDEPPSTPALDAAATLLAWIAARDGIDLSAERTIRFTSRGSNRWPKGSTVTTWPLAGHREMSLTSCPGDALFPLVRKQLLPAAGAIGASVASASPSPTKVSAPATPASNPPPGAASAPEGQSLGLPLGIGLGLAGLTAGGAWYLRRRRQAADRSGS